VVRELSVEHPDGAGQRRPQPRERLFDRVMGNTGFNASSDTTQIRCSASRTSALARNSPSQGRLKIFCRAFSSAMLSSVSLTDAEAARTGAVVFCTA